MDMCVYQTGQGVEGAIINDLFCGTMKKSPNIFSFDLRRFRQRSQELAAKSERKNLTEL